MNTMVLSYIPVDKKFITYYQEAGFEIHFALTPQERDTLAPELLDRVRAVLTIGTIGITREQIEALPNLEIICAQGVGYERIDLAAARAKNIQVTHGPNTNSSAVADHTVALMLAITREIAYFDHRTRQGEWAKARNIPAGMFGKKLGIIGMGNIGGLIAKRCAGGFEMPIGYFNRREIAESPYHYFDSPQSLAQWADYLVVATPGGKDTLKLVDAEVLHALGPAGYLINIARGSVVDTQAVIESLQNNTIAGAALDVLDGEPDVPDQMIGIRHNLVLTPHVAGRSPEAMHNMVQLVVENLRAHFRGETVKTPVPNS
ncbi:2-hydroxyacid dehydrogenase [Rouxiella sp. T17]|uniref:2-hydroxyacid dehydrogenase n=1 Tax=Rouxiella sp. T17 TaxID=3085684 RepID=UPI002FCA0AC5